MTVHNSAASGSFRRFVMISLLSATLGCDQEPPPQIDRIDTPYIDGLRPLLKLCGDTELANASHRGVVFINEVYAGSLADEQDDWIEIYNAGGRAIDLGGWVIEDYYTGDVPKDPRGHFEFPAGTRVCARGFVVVNRESGCELDPMAFDFGVGSTDRLVLTSAAGEAVHDALWYDLPAGQTIGRPNDSSEEFQRLEMSTPGWSNVDVCECCGECLLGRCTSRDGRCEAVTANDCINSEACRQLGWCTLESGRCVPSTPEHCWNSVLCVETGACELGDGRCEIRNDGDCQAAKVCENEGRCSFDPTLGFCVATSEADCINSDDCAHVDDRGAVVRKNRCTLEGNRCVAISCEDASVCQELMCCTLADGKCVGS